MTGSLIERVRERLASESGPLRPSVVAAAIRAESGGMLGDTEVLANLRVLQTELTGAGILEPLLSADGTTDVLVTAPDSVWVDDGNGLRRSQIRFADESAVRRLAQRLALAAGRRLDDAQPWVDGQLTGIGVGGFAVRLHAVLPPVATQGTCLSLRVLRPATQDLAALAAAGAIDPAAAALVADIVTARLAFLVCGGTGAGKTTLLAAMLGAVSPDERIVCVEDAAELAPRHPHLVKLVARRANVEGIGEVTCVNSSDRRCGCGPTASWSVRLGEPRWWICWRRSIPVTRAARAPYTPTTRVRSLHAWKRWGRSAALTALLCTASSPRQSKSCCTSRAIGQAVAGSPRSPCCAKLKGGSRR